MKNQAFPGNKTSTGESIVTVKLETDKTLNSRSSVMMVTIVNLIWSHQDEKISLWWGLFGAEDGRLSMELLKHGSGRRGVPHAVM